MIRNVMLQSSGCMVQTHPREPHQLMIAQDAGIIDFIVHGVAVFLTALLAYGILRVAPWLSKVIGKSGMTVITRMMGFIALAIGVQFVINGIAKFFQIGM